VRVLRLYEQITGRVPIEHLEADWLVTSFMERVRLDSVSLVVQRLLDLVGGLAGLVPLLVLLPFVGLAIRLESPGPIFYRQVRAGRGGRPFWLLKFRTMIDGAEADGQARWATAGDARVTGVGRFLRRARLDELPQVWNVLRGDMSLVGPRPERPELITLLEQNIPFYRARLLVKPGLTGWAQVNYGYGRSVDDAQVKLEYDLYYIKHQSLWLELIILFRTIAVVLGMKGS
jgi:exopolysaccharide biosynthesis polyprenyl glycosylphosphotransferase